MAEIEHTNQKQDFVPEKKPNIGQRFSFWLKTLTPKKKGLFWGAVILGLVVIILIAYFVFALSGDIGPTPVQPGIGKKVYGDTIYLTPDAKDVEKDVTFNVDINIRSENQDIVAVALTIDYDPLVLKLVDIEESEFFPVVADGNNPARGSYELARGVYGDGNPDNGYLGQDVKLATLKFQGIKFSQNTRVSLKNLQVVKDDGLGTLVDYQALGGSYNVVEDLPAISDLRILPYQSPTNDWLASITWQTNIKTKTKVYYIEKTTECSALDYTAADVVEDVNFIKDHGLIIPDNFGNPIVADKEYCVKVVAQDEAEREFEKYAEFFVGDYATVLSIKNLSAKPSYSSAIILWNTVGGENNGAADSRILSCRPSVNLPATNTRLTNAHNVSISGLQNSTGYECEVSSTDSSGASATKSISFTTAATQTFDANTILKVERDRECDQWIYCLSAVEIVNSKNETESLCFDVGVCDEKSPEDGSCIKPVKTTDSPSEQVFSEPSQIQNLSGLSKVGFTWGGDQVLAGYFHYNNMESEGADRVIPNGDFESGEIWPWSKEDSRNAVLKVVNDPLDNTNKVLQISPLKPTGSDISSGWSNVNVNIGRVSNADKYVVSLGIRSSSSGRDNQSKKVYIKFFVNNVYYDLTKPPLEISNYWQTITITSKDDGSAFTSANDQLRISGDAKLNISTQKNDSNSDYDSPFFIDNISMKSVLSIATDEYITRSCRLYPSESAPACNYVDVGGKEYHGWQGYCVEPDPKYFSSDIEKQMCLNWWPVDIIPGESDIFGSDQQAGYKGRQPLYYCLESSGNYPYVRNTRTGEMQHAQNFDEDIFWELMYKNWDDGCKEADADEECGWYGTSGVLNSSKIAAENFTIDEIEKIVLTPLCKEGDNDRHCFSKSSGQPIVLNKTNNWMGYMCVGGDNCPASYLTSWDQIKSQIEDTGNSDFFGVRANFRNDSFDGFSAGLYNWESNSNDEGFVRYRVTFYLRERCKVLAQVVTPDGRSIPWSSRVLNGGWVLNNQLSYDYSQDYAPYGASVIGEPISDPSQWQTPLYVMPLDDSLGQQKPYQVRAGSPYAVENISLNQQKFCANDLRKGSPCKEDEDCDVAESRPECVVYDDVQMTSDNLIFEGHGYNWDNTDGSERRFSFVPTYDIYKDEIDEITIYGVKMDTTGSDTSPWDCNSEDTLVGNNNSSQYNEIKFDGRNYDNWEGSYTSIPDTGNVAVNSLAYLRCNKSYPGVTDNNKNIITARLEFDSNDKLTAIYVEYNDGSTGVGDGYFDHITIATHCVTDKEIGICQEVSKNIGTAQCVAGEADKLGRECESSADCGYNYEGEGQGLCVGINLTDAQKDNIGGGWLAGQERLQQLFAKSYGVWFWEWDSVEGKMKYNKRTSANANIGWGDNFIKLYGEYKPQITHIKISEKEDENVIIQGPKSVILKFNSNVNGDHLPLTAYRVDWDDGSAISQLNNLKIFSRSSEDKPHVLFHNYECIEGGVGWRAICPDSGVTGGCCVYQPKVQIQDNWGWCNNGSSSDMCPTNSDSWERFKGRLIIKP